MCTVTFSCESQNNKNESPLHAYMTPVACMAETYYHTQSNKTFT